MNHANKSILISSLPLNTRLGLFWKIYGLPTIKEVALQLYFLCKWNSAHHRQGFMAVIISMIFPVNVSCTAEPNPLTQAGRPFHKKSKSSHRLCVTLHWITLENWFGSSNKKTVCIICILIIINITRITAVLFTIRLWWAQCNNNLLHFTTVWWLCLQEKYNLTILFASKCTSLVWTFVWICFWHFFLSVNLHSFMLCIVMYMD